MNTRPKHQLHKDLKVIATTIISMDIKNMSVDPNLPGHQTSKPR